MKLIARILTILCLLPIAGRMEVCATEPDRSMEELRSVLEKLPGNRIEADYSFKLMQGRTAVNCNGHAVLQDKCFHVFGNGMDIYCNGQTITYLDPDRKEAYIEDAVKLDEYVKANLDAIRDLKTSRVSSSKASDNLSEFDAPELDGDWVVTDLR